MMSDLISRQDAIDACLDGWNKEYDEILADIRALPSAEPEIILCKDCKHCKVLNKWFLYCTLHDIKNTPLIMDNFFCADGERKH